MTIRFGLSARGELHTAIRFYAREGRSLAADFVTEVAKSLEQIERNPRIGKRDSGGTRRYILKRFPYSLIYRLTASNAIELIAVHHQSRRPDYWRNRVREEPAVYALAA